MFLVLSLIGCALYPKVETFMSKQTDRAGLERRSVLVDGGSMYYWEGGNPNGEPLLWLHGFGGDALWAWARNLDDFSSTHRIIAPDMLWFGDSQGGLTLDAQARAVQHVLEAEGIESAHVIALSYGGFVGLKLVSYGSVESLVLIGVGGIGWDGEEIQALEKRFEVPRLEDLFVPSTVEDVDALVDVCFHAPTWLMPKDFDEHLYGTVFGKYPTEQRALISDLQQQSAEMAEWSDLWQTPPPTLLIVGRQDPIFSVEDVRELSDALNGTVKVISFADHVPQVGHARRFYRSARRFLNQHANPPSIDGNLEE
jgi:pimeloyl-ACP methyl ester carboxylesterase